MNGQIFDLMDALSDDLSFDYGAVLRAAQNDSSSAEAAASKVPDVDALVERARSIQDEERQLSTLTDLEKANERLARDRAQAINPVIVERFLRALVPAAGWRIEPQVGPGIYRLSGMSATASLAPLLQAAAIALTTPMTGVQEDCLNF